MADQTTPVQGGSATSQSQPVESPEVTAARAKAADAGYARNRAEVAYNAVKQEKGADSEEAKTAKQKLEAAQAEVEKAQGELRDALKLPSKKAPAPKAKPAEAKVPAQPAAEKPAPAPVEMPRGAYIQRVQVYEYIEILPVRNRGEILRSLEKVLKEMKVDPKNLEYYRKQLNGAYLEERQAPRLHGEMAIRRPDVSKD